MSEYWKPHDSEGKFALGKISVTLDEHRGSCLHFKTSNLAVSELLTVQKIGLSSAGTVTEVGLRFFEQLRVQTLPCLSH